MVGAIFVRLAFPLTAPWGEARPIEEWFSAKTPLRVDLRPCRKNTAALSGRSLVTRYYSNPPHSRSKAMFSPNNSALQSGNSIDDQRRSLRKAVFKSALLYPVLNQAKLAITNVSAHGVSGRTALTLSLREQVHVSFDEQDFITAEVRWTNGAQVGLLAEDPLLWTAGNDALMGRLSDSHQPRESRIPVNIAATLTTSAPVMIGTIRNMSEEGMMIEARSIREGTRLLVKCRGKCARMGRVQWSSSEMMGVFFERGV